MQTPLARDIHWLNDRLHEIEAGISRTELEQLRTVAAEMIRTGETHPDLAGLTEDQIHALLKRLTIRFHLRNKAEQVHIARVNRRRERDATAANRRQESIAEAVASLAAQGVALDDVLAILGSLDIQPTLTAHPTDARRRSVMHKQGSITDDLAVIDATDSTPVEEQRAASAVRQTLALLLATDEVRSRRLDVIDEVRNGIHYLAGAIWDAIPALYHDLAGAIRTHYDATPELPVFLRYRSWIGGDRDGNPNVTAMLTRRSLDSMRDAAIERHRESLEELRRELSISDRRVPIDPELQASIAKDEARAPLDPEHLRHLNHEPFRVKIRHMQNRIGDRDYTSALFIEDLLVLRRALRHAGLEEVAQRGILADMLVRTRTFGFHLAALDLRQHSRVHESAVSEMFRLAGVHGEYESLDETQRRDLLRTELHTSRPLLAHGAPLSPQTRELLDSLRVVAEASRSEPESIGSYVVSMAHDVSDLLEVLILFREVGLWTIQDGTATCPMDVAPLFETVDDLSSSADVIRALFEEPAYAAQLKARGRFQEIMLGYSDSNKDGGYWAANWRLLRAQDELAQACRDADVSFRFFHGRGGTVARGGGRAHRAILSSPPASRNGRIRFTEQGEVISFRYAMPAIAHRHLEQIVNAMIVATAGTAGGDAPTPGFLDMMNALADTSRRAYRSLIDHPDFWSRFVDRSPVLHIGALPIASRPVSRTGGEVTFDNLRAIPWVFAWTQMRYGAPGWFGTGTALDEIVMRNEEALVMCQDAYRRGGAFRAFIDNAQQEMARARLEVARWYVGEAGLGFHEQLAGEFGRAEAAILAITGQEALLDNNRVIQSSIRERNGDTDALNALQVELLRRWREAPEEVRPALRSLILLSVNGLAAAMQSTG